MKNTTFESAMNSSSFASTESTAKKNEPLMSIEASDKVKLYYDIFSQLENFGYRDLADAMYDVYYYYYLVVAKLYIKVSIAENDNERIITVGREKLTCNPNVDYHFMLRLLHYGRQAYIDRLRKYKDESLNYLKEFVENSCKEDLSDVDEATIAKIETVLKAEKRKSNNN